MGDTIEKAPNFTTGIVSIIKSYGPIMTSFRERCQLGNQFAVPIEIVHQISIGIGIRTFISYDTVPVSSTT